MLAHDLPGVLLYPDCNGKNRTTAKVGQKYELSIEELPTASKSESYQEFINTFEKGTPKHIL